MCYKIATNFLDVKQGLEWDWRAECISRSADYDGKVSGQDVIDILSNFYPNRPDSQFD